jgi:hypothetical protein
VANLSVEKAGFPVKSGGSKVVSVKVARKFNYNDAFKVELIVPNEADKKRVAGDPLNIPAGQNEGKLTLKVPAGLPPGKVENLIVRATATVGGNVLLVHDTKISVDIIPAELAKLTVDPAAPSVKSGGELPITLKLARLYDFKDAFKVEIVPPADKAKQLTAEPISIAAGQNDGKLTLKVPAGTPAGPVQQVIIRATATMNGQAIVHETKINVTITKEKDKDGK